MAEGTEPLDADVIRELRSLQAFGNPGFLKDLIDLFLSHGNQTFSELRAAFPSGSAAELVRLTHMLRGSAGCMGATRLSEMLGTLEDAIRSGVWDSSPRTMREIETEFARVCSALEAERDR